MLRRLIVFRKELSLRLFKKYLDVNQALTVSKTLVHETHERFLIIRKPFTMMLGFIDRRILWAASTT